MIRTLLKKQLLGALSVFTMGKNGKRRSRKAVIGFALLIVYAFFSVGIMFWEMADMLCEPLVTAGMAWVYFAFFGTIATGLGVVMGIFTAKARLYEARDNDLLLSMPIPSWIILLTRTIGLYVFTLFFEILVFGPAILCYFTVVEFSILPFLCCLIVLFILPCLALSISYTLGWLIALISAKLPGKNIIEMAFSIAFLVVYFLGYSKINDYLSYVLAHGESVGRVMKRVLYPFAQLGYACVGKGGALLLYLLMFVGVFALIYFLMSATYLHLATANKGDRKVKYTGKGYKNNSQTIALMKKELSRFTKKGMVMLNCFMGTILMVLFSIVALVDKEEFLSLTQVAQGDFSLILAALICAMASSNLLAPCCISMEGESINVVRVLPIKTETIFLAKGLANVLVTGIPAVFASIVLCAAFRLYIGVLVCVVLVALACVLFSTATGIAVNLLLPNLKWTNEVAVVKQSASSMVAMFGGYGVIALLVGGYFWFGKYLPAWGYMSVCAAFLFIAAIGVCIWLKKKGAKIFEEL